MRRKRDDGESCVPYSCAEEVDGRVDLQKTHGVAPRGRSGFRGRHDGAALTGLVESWSDLHGTTEESQTTVESSLVGNSKSNGFVANDLVDPGLLDHENRQAGGGERTMEPR